MGQSARRSTRSRALLIGCLVIGVGLALAPFAFQMFSRAPKGGDMLDGFRPYMNAATITGFQSDMDEIDAAVTEAGEDLEPSLEQHLSISGTALADDYPAYVTFVDEWPVIYADMSDMLTTMGDNLDNFAAVDALPPFAMFPWFFATPGVLIVGVSVWGLVRCRDGRPCRGPRVALGVLGVGLLLAPAAFQMFSRAPLGGDMIDDFSSLMTEEKIQRIQGYFLVIGAGEGAIRARVLPALEEQGGFAATEAVAELPALARFSESWPNTSSEMAPMIGAMSDNLENYLAVAALPPFPLFPWFFVIPGGLLIGFALALGTGTRSTDEPRSDTPKSTPLGGAT